MAESNGALEGSIDEAAMAIQKLMDGGGNNEPSDSGDELDQVAAQIEAKSAPEPVPETHTEEIPDEVASPSAQPAEASEDAQTQQAKEPTPAPEVKPAVQAPAKADAKSPTAQTQLTQLNQRVSVLQAELQIKFPDIKSMEDLERVASEDPARVIAFNIAERRLGAAVAQQQELEQTAHKEWLAEQTAELHRLIPDMADPVKGPDLGKKLTAYASEQNIPMEQLEKATAHQLHTLHKAMLWDEGQKSEKAKAAKEAQAIIDAKKKAADAPPVQKPGVAKSTDKKAERVKELEQRFEKTGRVDDLAALLSVRGH